MKKALLVVLVAILAAPLAQGEGPLDETRFTLREELLRLINRDRKQFGLPPVELDAFASTVADNFCEQQVRNRTAGHFTLDGLAPYMRYSFAGGNDGVSENVAAWSASFSFGARALYEMMHRSQEQMMGEIAPHDGHRKAILDPYATHVGIGMSWDHGEFRIAQEFIRRYLNWSRAVPRMATVDDRVTCSAAPIAGYSVEAITVHHESLPQPMSAIVANKIESYSLPQTRREYVPRVNFVRAKDGSFTFRVPFQDGAGVYTIVVWLQKKGETQAFPASNVSIRVDDVARVSYSSR